MKKLFFTFLASLFLLPASSEASGRVFMAPGEELKMQAEAFATPPAGYTWTITEGENTKEVRQKDISHTFPEEGTYTVEAESTSLKEKPQKTSVEIIVGTDQKNAQPLNPLLFTTPSANDFGTAEVSSKSPKVLFYAKESEGNIEEYRIDTNIAVDSDGDGNPSNDIDNANHASLFDGSIFPATLNISGESVTAELTLVDRHSNTQKKKIRFVYAESSATDLKAVVSTLPPSDARGEIRIPAETADVIFYTGSSTGDLIQYRIDTNIAVDSDGDGNPSNDIDNKSHPSFTTGEPFVHTYFRYEGNEQIAQIIAVSRDGKGSLLQRKVVFVKPAGTPFLEEKKNEMNPILIAEKLEGKPGESITFHVIGVPSEAKISWDANSDDTLEDEGKNTSFTHTYKEVGEYDLEVMISLGNGVVIRSEKIIISNSQNNISDPGKNEEDSKDDEKKEGETIPPASDFTFEKDGSVLRVKNVSTADASMEGNILSYLWDFGDGNTSTEESPEYTFTKAGEYTVALTATDSAGSVSSKNVPVFITKEDLLRTFPEGAPEEDDIHAPTFQKDGGDISFTLPKAFEGQGISWDFGDGNISNEENPNHTFDAPGEYTVTMTATDAEGNITTKTTTVTVTEEDLTGGTVIPPQDDDEKGGFSWWKFLLFLPLILLFILLIIILILLFFRKVESPDLHFEEIIHEEIDRWRGRIRTTIQEPSVKKAAPVAASTSPFVAVTEKEEKKIKATKVAKVVPVVSSPVKKEKISTEGKMPDWLKAATTETEKEPKEKKAKQAPPTPASEKSKEESASGPLPDWLKPEEQKTTKKQEPSESPRKEESSVSQTKAPEKKSEPPKEDLPDWLKTQTENAPAKKIEKPVSPQQQAPKMQPAPQKKQVQNVPPKPASPQKSVRPEGTREAERRSAQMLSPNQKPAQEKSKQVPPQHSRPQPSQSQKAPVQQPIQKATPAPKPAPQMAPKQKQQKPQAPELPKQKPQAAPQMPKREVQKSAPKTPQGKQNSSQILAVNKNIPPKSISPKWPPEKPMVTKPMPDTSISASAKTQPEKSVVAKAVPDKPEIVPHGTEILHSVQNVTKEAKKERKDNPVVRQVSGDIHLPPFGKETDGMEGEENLSEGN